MGVNGEVDGTKRIRVLVIEDAAEIAALIRLTLEREDFAVDVAVDGRTGIALARSGDPDVVLLDIGLPDIDGWEVCRQLRTFSDAYVVMLTARDGEVDRVVGLTLGADDYVTKPFGSRELVARIRAMLRRPRGPGRDPAAADGVRRFGDLTIDPGLREVRVGDRVVGLTRLEYGLLATLVDHPRHTLSREQLLDHVWGPDWFGSDHLVDVHVSNLRRKLGDDSRDPRYVRTVRGYGFRLGDG